MTIEADDKRFETLDKKLDQILQVLSTLTSGPQAES